MAIVEDLTSFVADFGVPCLVGAVSFTGVLDQPDELQEFQRASVHSREYLLTYITSTATLTRGTPVTVDGQAFVVRENPRQVDDGAFSQVLLSKV